MIISRVFLGVDDRHNIIAEAQLGLELVYTKLFIQKKEAAASSTRENFEGQQ